MFVWLGLALHWSRRAERHKHDDMIRLNNCIPGPVYPLSTERTVSQSCMGAGQEGGSAQRGQYQFGTLALRSKSCAAAHRKTWDRVKCVWGSFQMLIVFLILFFQVVRKMMWLMDHVFKYTNFGLVSLIHGDFFIRQVRLRMMMGSGVVCSAPLGQTDPLLL